MTNKLEILYPRFIDFKNENQKDNPAIYYHFSYFENQCVITKKYSKYVVKTMSFIPTFIYVDYREFDFSKEWFDWFTTTDIDSAIFFFQKVVKDMILTLNNVNLSKKFKKSELLEGFVPRQICDVVKVFE